MRLTHAADLADRIYLMARGRARREGTVDSLMSTLGADACAASRGTIKRHGRPPDIPSRARRPAGVRDRPTSNGQFRTFPVAAMALEAHQSGDADARSAMRRKMNVWRSTWALFRVETSLFLREPFAVFFLTSNLY